MKLLPLIAAAIVGIAPAVAQAPEKLAADKAITTSGGATFTAPVGWTIRSSGPMVSVEAPEADSRVAIFHSDAPSADAAVDAAWAAYNPGAKRPLRIKRAGAPREGWEEIQAYIYETSPNEKATVMAQARRSKTAWTVMILDGKDATFEKRAAAFGLLSVGTLVLAFLVSSFVGGESIAKRFTTLLAEDPRSLYVASRGQQLSDSVGALAAEYPLGAGLARWGMMNGYFGDPGNLDAAPMWAEIMPVAWVIDGGLVLMGLYSAALVATLRHQWRLVRQEDDESGWTAAVVAVNVGTLALVFSFVPFVTQVGLQFWFLEGALHGAVTSGLVSRDSCDGAAA